MRGVRVDVVDIFLSYLRPDWQTASLVANALERSGYSVSWDFPSWVGEPLIDAIDRERARARCVVVLWSRHSVHSARLLVEAKTARRAGTLVQARIDRLEAPADTRTLPMVDLVGWRGEDTGPAMRALQGLVARALEEPGRPSALGLGLAPWRFPARARARQAALCALPFLALPVAVSAAKGITEYLASQESAVSEPVQTARAAPQDRDPVSTADLLAEAGLCQPVDDEASLDAAAAGGVRSEPALAEDGRSTTDLLYAAMRGDEEAQYRLALRYLQGEGVTPDEPLGLAWLEKAAEAGLVRAQMELADLYMADEILPRNMERAVGWLRKAAEAGHPDAQYNLAVVILKGEGVPRDAALARQWFEKAAGQGLVDASYNLGVLYANGWGTQPDHARAIDYLEVAAEAGRAEAAWALGLLLHDGDASVQDKTRAAQWFKRAAQANHANAQYIMSILHVKGEGVQRSEALAYLWLELAIAGGADQDALRRDLLAAMGTAQAQAALDAVKAASRCLGPSQSAPEGNVPADLLS